MVSSAADIGRMHDEVKKVPIRQIFFPPKRKQQRNDGSDCITYKRIGATAISNFSSLNQIFLQAPYGQFPVFVLTNHPERGDTTMSKCSRVITSPAAQYARTEALI